jgi:hypothetical protein
MCSSSVLRRQRQLIITTSAGDTVTARVLVLAQGEHIYSCGCCDCLFCELIENQSSAAPAVGCMVVCCLNAVFEAGGACLLLPCVSQVAWLFLLCLRYLAWSWLLVLPCTPSLVSSPAADAAGTDT